jgi:hypothetical protein
MLFTQIPARLDVRSEPFTGIYDRRKMASPGLFCWFNNDKADEDNFPHVSINDARDTDGAFTDFHVSYPLLHEDRSSGSTEKRSFSIYYKITGASVVRQSSKFTGYRSDADPNPIGMRQLTELADTFALRFFHAAVKKHASTV